MRSKQSNEKELRLEKIASIALIAVVAFVAMVGGRYYRYATNTRTPFDEVGIRLNALMPGPIRDWGRGKLKQTFETKTAPPHGCSGPNGQGT
jgi:hypothetical protein